MLQLLRKRTVEKKTRRVRKGGSSHSDRGDHHSSWPPQPSRGGFWLLCLVDSLKFSQLELTMCYPVLTVSYIRVNHVPCRFLASFCELFHLFI